MAFENKTQAIEGETFDHFRTKSKEINSTGKQRNLKGHD